MEIKRGMLLMKVSQNRGYKDKAYWSALEVLV